MLKNNIIDIPSIVFLRNDKILYTLIENLIRFDSLNQIESNQIKNSIKDFYPNTFRLEEVDLSLKYKNFNKDIFDIKFLSLIFNFFYKVSGSKIFVKEDKNEAYLSYINKISPLQIIGYKLAQDFSNNNLLVNDVFSFIEDYTPLGFEVDKVNKYAENHLHLKGSNYVSFNMLKLFSYDTKESFFKESFLSYIPRINEFSYINNHLISFGQIIEITKLSIDYIYGNILNIEQNNIEYQEKLNKVFYLNKKTNIKYKYSIKNLSDFEKIFNFYNNSKESIIIKKIISLYNENNFSKAHLLEYTLFFYFYEKTDSSFLKHFIRIYIISINILRSYMVMSQNCGLSSFSEFSGSQLRNIEKRNAKNISYSIKNSGTNFLNSKLDIKKSANEISNIILDFKDAFSSKKSEHKFKFNFSLSTKKSKEEQIKILTGDLLPLFYKKRNNIKEEAISLNYFLTDIQFKNINKFKNELHYSQIKAYKRKKELENKTFDLSSFIVSIDAVGKETHTPPEVFAPFFKYIRKQPKKLTNNIFSKLKNFKHHPKLLITAHAGEDFNHIITGMRRVDECIKFFDMERRDRLGHVLSLGINPKQWQENINHILIEKGDFLDDLVWLVIKLKCFSNKVLELNRFISKYEDKALKLFREIYPICEYKNIYITDIYEAWEYRSNCSLTYYKKKQNVTLFDEYSKVTLSNMPNKTACEIFELYQTNKQVREISKEVITIDKFTITNEELKIWEALQDYMINEIGNKGIIIETNPSSNIFTSSLETYNYHPIFRFYPPKKELYERGGVFNKYNQRNGKVAVTINSDDPAIFVTTLQNEYRVIKNVAIKQFNCTDKEAEDWIEDIRKFGIRVFKESYIGDN